MTENEKPKRDYLKWWLIIVSFVSAAFIVMFTALASSLGFVASVIVILANVMAWITWKNEKHKNVGLKIWLIFATVVAVLFSAISGFFTVKYSQLEIWWVVALSIIILCGILFSMFSTWECYLDGKNRLAIIFSVIMVIVSFIQALALAVLLSIIFI